MEEITKTQFFQLQAAIDMGILEKITGKLEKRINSETGDIIYKNLRGNWMMTTKGFYFAKPVLVKWLAKNG